MNHEQRANHIAQLLTYCRHLECKLAIAKQELAELTSPEAVTSSTKTRRDGVGQALLDQRASMSGYDVVADAWSTVEAHEAELQP
jgi:hypothetical protein